jgi:hypothetical protein
LNRCRWSRSDKLLNERLLKPVWKTKNARTLWLTQQQATVDARTQHKLVSLIVHDRDSPHWGSPARSVLIPRQDKAGVTGYDLRIRVCVHRVQTHGSAGTTEHRLFVSAASDFKFWDREKWTSGHYPIRKTFLSKLWLTLYEVLSWPLNHTDNDFSLKPLIIDLCFFFQ